MQQDVQDRRLHLTRCQMSNLCIDTPQVKATDAQDIVDSNISLLDLLDMGQTVDCPDALLGLLRSGHPSTPYVHQQFSDSENITVSMKRTNKKNLPALYSTGKTGSNKAGQGGTAAYRAGQGRAQRNRRPRAHSTAHHITAQHNTAQHNSHHYVWSVLYSLLTNAILFSTILSA